MEFKAFCERSTDDPEWLIEKYNQKIAQIKENPWVK
jgi:hypothetical protein